jgi:hypothetical protein
MWSAGAPSYLSTAVTVAIVRQTAHLMPFTPSFDCIPLITLAQSALGLNARARAAAAERGAVASIEPAPCNQALPPRPTGL